MPPNRENGGRVQRLTTVEQIALAERARQQKEQEVVLAQPHRRGSRSQLVESVLGRFCERLSLRRELFDAGMEYGAMKRRFNKATGAPMPDRIEGSGVGIPDAEDVQRWAQRISEMEYAMSIAGGNWRAVADMAAWEMLPSRFVADDYVVKALLALAVECGRLDVRALPR